MYLYISAYDFCCYYSCLLELLLISSSFPVQVGLPSDRTRPGQSWFSDFKMKSRFVPIFWNVHNCLLLFWLVIFIFVSGCLSQRSHWNFSIFFWKMIFVYIWLIFRILYVTKFGIKKRPRISIHFSMPKFLPNKIINYFFN